MTPQHPFTWVPAAHRPLLLGIAFLATVAFGFLLARQGKPLNTALPRAIIAYEFAWTAERVNEIKHIWRGAIDVAQRQIRLDFVFLLLYPVLLSLACAMLSDCRFAAMAPVGIFISWAVLAAAPLDAVENWALLHMLDHSPTDLLARLAGYCAGLKFALVFSAVGYLILEGAVVVIRMCRAV